MRNRHERRAAKKRQRKAPAEQCAIVFDGTDLFFIIDGQRVAKRGHQGTPQAKQWIPLIPDFSMHDNLYGGSLDALDEIKDNHHAH